MTRGRKPPTIGEKIKAARVEADLTLEALAERIGSSAETVGQYERGVRTPPVPRLLALADALGTTASGLLDGVRSIPAK